MLIDWFTVGAQILNFLILVWLLKRFLYQPILHAIDAREKRIATELADADAKKAEAQKERDAFQQKNEAIDQQRDDLLRKAADDAQVERQRLLDEARQAAEILRLKRQEALRTEVCDLKQAIQQRTRQEVFAITRKTLADLAATSLEERLVEVLLQRLRGMDGKAKEGFAEALKKNEHALIVRSAFALPDEQREAMHQGINTLFSAETSIQFETKPDLICGIELATNGQKVAWSIADYLLSLEQGVDELLQHKAQPEAKETPQHEHAQVEAQSL
jgi:F-type H+-transporting ATPase subunit b